jgi:hypothetical protein
MVKVPIASIIKQHSRNKMWVEFFGAKWRLVISCMTLLLYCWGKKPLEIVGQEFGYSKAGLNSVAKRKFLVSPGIEP